MTSIRLQRWFYLPHVTPVWIVAETMESQVELSERDPAIHLRERRTAGELWEHGPRRHLTNTNEYSLFRARSNMAALCSFDKSMCYNIWYSRTTHTQPDVPTDAQINLQITLVCRFCPVHTLPTFQSSPVEFYIVMGSFNRCFYPKCLTLISHFKFSQIHFC